MRIQDVHVVGDVTLSPARNEARRQLVDSCLETRLVTLHRPHPLGQGVGRGRAGGPHLLMQSGGCALSEGTAHKRGGSVHCRPAHQPRGVRKRLPQRRVRPLRPHPTTVGWVSPGRSDGLEGVCEELGG
eukprot:725636-Prorocentrum_minimum.AAC.2